GPACSACPPLRRAPPPFLCRSRHPTQFQVVAARSAKIRRGHRRLRAPKDTARPFPNRNPPSEPAAAARLEFFSPPANRAPAAPHHERVARRGAHFPAKQQDSLPGSKVSARDPR